MDNVGFILRQVDHLTAPTIVCEGCGEIINDYQLAWVVWSKEELKDGERTKALVVCKKNRCNSKQPYRDFPSMEMRDYLINLCRNAGVKTEQQFREAFEFTQLADNI